MKTLKIILILMLFVNISKAQDNYYYYQGEKISLELNYEKVYVKFKEGRNETQKRQIIKTIPSLSNFTERSNGVVVADLLKKMDKRSVNSVINQLNKNKDVIIANPFIISEDGVLQGITDNFIVKLKSPSDFIELEKIAEESKTIIFKQNEYEPSVYILIADKNSNGNALEMANYFYESGKFEFAEPSFLRIVRNQCSNDPFFSEQWALSNTGQHNGISGADINICSAWEITEGRDVVSVAVIDEGVDLNHPDLINNLLPGFDATGNGSNGAPQDDDAHGTACAGIIAASRNNGIGIAGVAPNCRIIPIRVIINGFIDTDVWAADGINWAWQNGADILSNSWRFGTASNLITTAINNAVSQGRDGLGCPVLFAAGNFNSNVTYPASLPNTIAVGAMSMCNERKRSSSNSNQVNPGVSTDPKGTSCDDETWWGSCFGSELDLVAPGVKISTTDISGPDGYNNVQGMEMHNDDYVANYNGTSSSCPYAAGTMSLILSVNLCLTQNEARQILELSCDKVGGYCYTNTSGHPNGTWNNEMGHGRINAFRAVTFAFSQGINNFTNIGDPSTISVSDDIYAINIATGCAGVAAGNYFVKRHEVIKDVVYPFTAAPFIIGTSNGLSQASPNDGNFWMDAINVTETSARLRTYVYETFNVLGQQIGFVPTSPSNIKFNYAVLSAMELDIFLQNESVSTGTVVHNAMNIIESGNDVTNNVPNGDYVIEGDANVTLHAGNSITLKPGTVISPGPNGSFHAFVDPFFTCTQYPMGMVVNNNDDFPPVIKNYEVERLENSEELFASTDLNNLNQKTLSLKNYPNPFSDNTTIEYQIDKSEKVTIEIYDNCGRPVYKLKNKQQHEAGIYQVKLDGINLASGTYYCTLTTENRVQTIELVVTK